MFSNGRTHDVNAAHGLGWASIGIGLTELAAPQQVEELLGIEDSAERRGILRVLGIRELMHGIGILAEPHANHELASGVWARVAGDALDTALLGIAAVKTRTPGRFAATAAMVGVIGLLDTLYALRVQRDASSRFRNF